MSKTQKKYFFCIKKHQYNNCNIQIVENGVNQRNNAELAEFPTQ